MRKHLTRTLLATLLPASMLLAATDRAPDTLQTLPLDKLEQHLEDLDNELSKLARFSLNSAMGPIGYRSDSLKQAPPLTWLRIDLPEPTALDQIVLVPTLRHTAEGGYRADGFPLKFRIVAGTGADTEGAVVATFDPSDNLLPRIAPLMVACSVTASWVRVEATQLSIRTFDGRYSLDLAEIMLFDGPENVALHQSVSASTQIRPDGGSRKKEYLVDGYVPYLMHSGGGTRSRAFIGKSETTPCTALTIDLGQIHPVNRIHLHAIELTDSVPRSHPPHFGLPNYMVMEGALHADFSDATPLVEYTFRSVFEKGPVITHRFPAFPCRYVRLVVKEPYLFKHEALPPEALSGFAEVEVFANGRNVALGQPVRTDLSTDGLSRNAEALNDGRNIYGLILPLRDWMEQLARRHDLETQRPEVLQELALRHKRQQANLRLLAWLAALLAAGIGFTILIDRMLRMRQLARTKERFAADLHDELGANIHAIELLNEEARYSDSAEERTLLADRITDLTKRTSSGIRHCTNMLEAESLHFGLADDMKRSAQRIATNIDHNFSVEGQEFIDRLRPKVRVDLFLFYKECLINICRHSGATKMKTHMQSDTRTLRLTVEDNGLGIEESPVPHSLQRRAKLLKAEVTAYNLPSGGTRISLTLKPRFNRSQRKSP